MPQPPQLVSFDAEEQQFYSELPLDVQAPHRISKAEPIHPTEETYFDHLYLPSHSFSTTES